MKLLYCGILLFSTMTAWGQTREVCVTIDDLPVAGGDQNDIRYQQSVTDDLLKALTSHRVPAIGFVIEHKVYTNDTIDRRKTALLERWLAQGMELGNHTFAHKDYNDIPFSEMADDVVKGEPVVSGLLKAHGMPLTYLRHPFFHRGNTKEKADSLAAFLARRGYTEAPVTIDNSDWIYAMAYGKAWTSRDTAQMASIGASYVDYMEQKVKYYEGESVRLFGYEMKQILIIHASRLNADLLDALARMLERRGYAFVSLSRALTDPAFRSADTFYRKGGISWLDRWALTAGKHRDFFKDEPRVPDQIMKTAGVDSE